MPFQRRMRPLSLSKIRVTDPFWGKRRQIIREVSLPTQFQKLVETGRIAHFLRAAGKEEGKFEGFWFNDSDVYKWAEAVAYALSDGGESKELRSMLDTAVTAVTDAQEPSGYINTFFQLNHPDMKWRNLNMMHEMYCGGHLIEAGVALQDSIGDSRLLDVSIRFADHVMDVFGPGKRRGYCGHEEIELALIRLADCTGEAKYRDFANWLVEERGHRPSVFEEELANPETAGIALWGRGLLEKDGKYSGEYAQDHAPIRDHTQVVGHAVRAMYLYIAAAELAEGKNDVRLEEALTRCWENLTQNRMYITGGIGPSAKNEGFTADFDLPNMSAYAETCAAIGLVFWGQKLLELTAVADYADVIERALFNGVLCGISLSGDKYFYDNPLESRGQHDRKDWFPCSCCPPNLARLIANLGTYLAGANDHAFYIHQFAGFEAKAVLGGVPTKITVESNFPWSGELKVHVEPERPTNFALHLRIPEWSDELSTDIEGDEQEAGYETGYGIFDRLWSPGDVLTVDLGLQPQWMVADPRVRDDLGRVAMVNGPVVYCAESVDLGAAPQLFSVDTAEEPVVGFEEILEGVNVIEVNGLLDVEGVAEGLYGPLGSDKVREGSARLIPFYAWNNRGPDDMQVWLRRS